MLDHDAIARLLHVLDRDAPDYAGPARRLWHAAAAPLRVRVTGRAWAGSTTVAALLSADEFAVVDTGAELTVYVLPGSLRTADEHAIETLDSPLVVLNKADGISPEPAEVGRVCATAAQKLQMTVLPLTAHIAGIHVDQAQFDAVRELSGVADAGARVATIVFGDSPLRAWGPPAVAVAVSALRLNPALDAAGVAAVLRAYSGVDALLDELRERLASRSSGQFGEFLDVLERAAAQASARDEIEAFLSGPTAGEIALRAALWRGETIAELRSRTSLGTAAERRATIRAERALSRRLKSA